MTVLNMEKAKKHQELMRELVSGLDFENFAEYGKEHLWGELEAMLQETFRRWARNGLNPRQDDASDDSVAADLGYLMMQLIYRAAQEETAPEVERWADEEEDREIERRRLASPITKAGVYLNTGRFLHP